MLAVLPALVLPWVVYTGASAFLFGKQHSRPALPTDNNGSLESESLQLDDSELFAPYEALPELVQARLRERQEMVARGNLKPLKGRRLGGVLLPHKPHLATCEYGKQRQLVPSVHVMKKVRMLSAQKGQVDGH